MAPFLQSKNICTCRLFSLNVNELILTWLLQHKIQLSLLQNQDFPCCGHGTWDLHHSLELKPYRVHLWFHKHMLDWPSKGKKTKWLDSHHSHNKNYVAHVCRPDISFRQPSNAPIIDEYHSKNKWFHVDL